MAAPDLESVVSRVEAAASRFEASEARVVAELEKVRLTMSDLQIAQKGADEREKSRTKDLERVEKRVDDQEARIRSLERMVWKAVGAGLAAGALGSFIVQMVTKGAS